MTERLKKETRELHEEVERSTIARDILNHSIDRNSYKLLLYQNYIAYAVTENVVAACLENYSPNKHQRLKQDLAYFNVQPKIPAGIPLFECHNSAEAYGAAYVIEGSTLGGMLISRNLQKCQHLKDIENHYFFNGDKTAIESWNQFKAELNSQDFTEVQQKQAIEKAKETFQFFGEILKDTSLVE